MGDARIGPRPGHQVAGLHVDTELVQRAPHQAEVHGTHHVGVLAGDLEEGTATEQQPWRRVILTIAHRGSIAPAVGGPRARRPHASRS